MKIKKALCPNCGICDVNYKWIKKWTKPNIEEVSFDELAVDEYNKTKQDYNKNYVDSSYGFRSTISISGLYDNVSKIDVADCIQLIISCSRCGYVKVFDVNSLNVMDEL